MLSPPKILMVCAALAIVPACSSELSEDEQAILDKRLADEAVPTNLTAVVQANENLSTASTLVGMSGIAAELKDDGPFTAFTATNEAFNKMDQELLSGLMSAEDKTELAAMAKYGLANGTMTSADIVKAIADGGGSTTITTLQGGAITATMDGDKVVLEDGAGNKANIVEADVESSNGTLHIIDTVLMPG